MKNVLFCGMLVALLGFLNASVSQTWVDLGREQPTNFGQTPQALAYVTASTVGYTVNSSPYGTSYGTASYDSSCNYHITDAIVLDFRHAVYKFITSVYKKSAALSYGHFVFSPHTMWLSLAALAEGSEGETRQQLFSYLSLPDDLCVRQTFYKLATTREYSSNAVVLARNRLFVTDSNIRVNRNWEDFARSHTQLNTISVPFKANPSREIEILKRVFNARLPNMNLSGNSFLLESLDYHGLWTSAFTEAIIETGPFYDPLGEQIGTLEYMKTRKLANIGFVSSVGMKLLDLPVGRDGRYRMFFALPTGKNFAKSLGSLMQTIVFETVGSLRKSPVPVEIVIPRLTMTTEIDVRLVLEDLGIKNLWTDPVATRNISEPSALPSSFIQRVTVTLDNGGVRPSSQEDSNVPPAPYGPSTAYPTISALSTQSGLFGAPDIKSFDRDFIANKPFLFGLFDSETFMCLFAATFSKISHF